MDKQLNFDKMQGLVPAVVQDASTGSVLMVGFMNREAYEVTIRTHRVTFWSRTKSRLWTKGESSGNTLHVVSVTPDCDGDSLLVRASPSGPTCHTGAESCFGEDATLENPVLRQLEQIVLERKAHPRTSSRTTKLFDRGHLRIAQKVGEEAVETILASTGNDNERTVSEAADLLYHLTVLFAAKGIEWKDVEGELERRMTR